MTVWWLAIGFAFVMLASLAGWGRGVSRLLRISCPLGWPEQFVLGIGAMYAVGGVLTCFRWVSVPACWAFWIAGVAFWAAGRSFKEHVGSLTGLFRGEGATLRAVGLLLALVPIAGAARFGTFNNWDDLMGYLVFPERLLQTGELGSDPFFERRAVSLPAAYFFLLTAQRAVLGRESMLLLEQGVAPLVLGAFAYRAAMRHLADRRQAGVIGIAFAAAVVVLAPALNTSSILLAAVIMCAVYARALIPGENPAAAGRAIGALVAIAVGTKNNLALPSAIAFAGLAAGWMTARGPRALRSLIPAAFAGGLPILGWWLWEGFQNQGTPLFPLLGRGFHSSAYDGQLTFAGDVGPKEIATAVLLFLRLPSVWAASIAGFVIAGLLVSDIRRRAGKSEIWDGWPGPKRWETTTGFARWAPLLAKPSLWVALAAVGGGAANSIAVNGMGPQRFSLPVVSAAVLWLGLEGARRLRTKWAATSAPGFRQSLARTGPAIYVVTLCAMIVSPAVILRRFSGVDRAVSGIQSAWRGWRLDPPELIERYRKLSAALPVDGRILARLDRPYLLDFRGRTIHVADAPCGASLPPGMPVTNDPEVLARYLETVGVPYLVYAYANHAGFGPEIHHARFSRIAWDRLFAIRTIAFQEAAAALGKSRRKLYDDGHVFVVDLRSRAAADEGAPR